MIRKFQTIFVASLLVFTAAGPLALTAYGQAAPELPKNEEHEAELLATAGDGFKIRRTQHFAIAYDTPYNTVLALEGRLEGTYNSIHRFCNKEGLIAATPESKLRVVLFAAPEAYAAACRRVSIPADAGGFYDQRTNISFFMDALARPEFAEITAEIDRLQQEITAQRDATAANAREMRDALLRHMNSLRMCRDADVERVNRLVIQHEAAHQLLFNLGVHRRGAPVPEWLVEGFACQFEVSQPTSETGLKKVNMLRLADFREAFAIPPSTTPVPAGRYTSALDEGRMLPLRELIGGATTLVAPGVEGTYRYAEAWSFVHFLHREHRVSFKEYVQRTAERKPGDVVTRDEEIALFETLFGPIDAEFQDRWVHFTLGRSFDPNRLDP